jgi:hypothetical protein
MDQGQAQSAQNEAFPIFDVYRRGYDPEQVDRYIAEQQRRLDEALQRSSESERKLAAAVGQLRELHRRVAALESDDRSQGPSLDMLGERVQRILQESWEGAYALRQAAEREVAEQREEAEREVSELRERVRAEVETEREQAEREVAELLDAAQRRAALMRAETDRRRQAYLDRVEEDRARAVNQIAYLYDQRQLALGELARLQANIGSTVGEMAKSPLGVPSVNASTGPRSVPLDEMLEDESPTPRPRMQPATSSFERPPGRMPGLERPILERPMSTQPVADDRPTSPPERIEDTGEVPAQRPSEHLVIGEHEEDEFFATQQPPAEPLHRAERREGRVRQVFDFDDE